MTLLAAFLVPFTLLAQKDSTLEQRIGRSFCVEFQKIDKEKLKSKSWDVELGLTILPLIQQYKDDIKKEWGLSADDEGGFEKIGEKIGQVAAMNCPAFQEFVMNNIDKIKDMDDEDEERNVSGQFIRLEQGLFSYIVIKAKNGKEEKLWWFEYFKGADELLAGLNDWKNKPVTFTYRESEVFDATLKEYRKIKIITGVTRN